jgi:hypothetical protein
MSEATVIPNNDIKTQVSVKQPMFNGQTVLCTIGEITTTIGDDKIRQWNVPLVFQESAKTTEGKEVPPGYKLVDRIDLDPRGKRSQEQCDKDLGWLQVAALKLSDVRSPIRASEIIGQQVKVLFTIRQFKRQDGNMGEAQQCKYLRADR